MMWCRGIRGATTADSNTREHILEATQELVSRMLEANEVRVEDVACIIFTTTPDLNAEFPAVAARQLGLSQTALLCGQELDIPGSLPLCLRVLILYNTEKGNGDIMHVYLKDAKGLRSDSVMEETEQDV